MAQLKNFWLYGLLILISACQNEADKTQKSAPNKFSDPVLVEIYDLQDRRDADSLLQYFDDENPEYRAAAAEAFGSIQDSLAIPMLAVLLNDQNTKVRKAAAYALGQTYDSAAIEPLNEALMAEDSLFVKRELFEALGKVVTQSELGKLVLEPTATEQEEEGLAWGLYRAGVRNVHDDLSVGTAVALLDAEKSYLTRLGAAHFLSRSRNIELTRYLPQLIAAATEDSAANVRMAAALALGKIETPTAMQTLAESCTQDRDYRVRINALRSLGPADFDKLKEIVYKLLEDKNVNVAIAAANLISQKDPDAIYIAEQALKHDNWRVKAILLGAALKAADDKTAMSDQIKTAYEKADNPYYKAALLAALGNHIPNYEFVVTETFQADKSVVSTAGTNALVSMRASEDFPEELESAFAGLFKELMQTADIAIVAIVAQVLVNPDYDFKTAYDDYGFLKEAKSKLSLPKDNEALQVLNRTIALFEGEEAMPTTENEFNHPINWDLVKTIDKAQKATIKTAKGNVTLKLLVEEAPGSVVNFYTLAQDEYFNGKNFHRVVPNFVVQGGCNRGDGYGGENYSIRSEFANCRYTTGSVGMASAGKDTEGTQWFITHSPTPHLDGRYTIFAEVVEGMDVVHAMEVGDVIESIDFVEVNKL